MHGPNFQDRIERNYDVAISESNVAELWRDLRDYLPRYNLNPVYAITCVGSVYFENRELDLTRCAVMNRRGRYVLLRLRTYEDYGETPQPISYYWVEVKTRDGERWKKKRLRLHRADLPGFLEGRDGVQKFLDENKNGDPEVLRRLYHNTQETVLTMGLDPVLLITYRRVAFENEIERVCLDWDIQYYHVTSNVYYYDSWKYPLEEAAATSKKILLEVKFPAGCLPAWIPDLEKRYPIGQTNFSKYLEGMASLFEGPLKHHKDTSYLLPKIDSYVASRERF